VVFRDGLLLAAQRGPGKDQAGRWEFPVGETEIEALSRELAEELSVIVAPMERLGVVHHEYERFHIELIPFCCELTAGNLSVSEHQELRWLTFDDRLTVDWCEADHFIAAALEPRHFELKSGRNG
jgi:8-oxo-dGTP diphosphatase